MLLDILMKLEEIHEGGNSEVLIRWHFPEDDEDMLEAGQGFSKMVRFPFNYIKY